MSHLELFGIFAAIVAIVVAATYLATRFYMNARFDLEAAQIERTAREGAINSLIDLWENPPGGYNLVLLDKYAGPEFKRILGALWSTTLDDAADSMTQTSRWISDEQGIREEYAGPILDKEDPAFYFPENQHALRELGLAIVGLPTGPQEAELHRSGYFHEEPEPADDWLLREMEKLASWTLREEAKSFDWKIRVQSGEWEEGDPDEGLPPPNFYAADHPDLEAIEELPSGFDRPGSPLAERMST